MTDPLHISEVDAATARQNGFVQWVYALRRTLVTTPVGWLLVAWFGSKAVPHDLIFMWLGVFAAVWAGGLWVLWGVIRQGPSLVRHRTRTFWVAGSDGMAWGLMAWFLMGHDPIHDATLTAMLCGVIAINAQVYVTFIRAYYVMVGVLWLVFITGMLRIADHPHTIDYAAGLSVFVGLTLYYMRNIAKRVAQGIALQLANVSLTEQLRVALQMVRLDAATDALTGQGNRRALDELLKQQMEFSAQTGRTFSILMLDIDFFKRSTTFTATWWATMPCVPLPSVCASTFAWGTYAPALAARSLWLCCLVPRERKPWKWPSACVAGSRRSHC